MGRNNIGNNRTANKKKRERKSQAVPRHVIVWQKDIRIPVDRKDAFIQHVTEKYYAPLFTGYSAAEITDRVKSIIKSDEDGQGEMRASLPVIAAFDRKEDDWKEFKASKKTIYYYKPIPPMEDREVYGKAIDDVFSDGDKIIESLLNGEPSCLYKLKDWDQARDIEKQAFVKLLKTSGGKDAHGSSHEDVVRLEKDVTRLEEEKDSLVRKLSEAKEDLNKADEKKRKAVKEREEEWESKYNSLFATCQNSENAAEEYKKKWNSEKQTRIECENTIASLNTEISGHKNAISRMEKEARLYTERAVFFHEALGFAKRTMTLFDTLDQMMDETGKLKVNMPNNVNADDYNYYLMRIERKYYAAISKADGLAQWRHELQMLARTGMAPAGGMIDSKIGGGKVKEEQQESTLRTLLYKAVMTHLAGAAVVMCDELALMLPKMVAGVNNTKHFADISSRLQKTIADMGYRLCYVKPFTRLDSYKDVKNVEFTKADVPEGTIFEILRMALNFGESKSKTEVSAK